MIPAGTGVKLYNKLHVYNKKSGDLKKVDNIDLSPKEEDIIQITVWFICFTFIVIVSESLFY